MAESKNSNSQLAEFVRMRMSPRDGSFPEQGTNYFERFVQFDNYFNKEIHPNVNQGATAREPIWLTDHGPEHIATVIRRASALMCPNDNCRLTPYEAYLLLVAIHLHDVGNVFGRPEHEKKCRDILFDLDHTLVGGDAFEKRMMCDIAMAHGGYADEDNQDKDTISKLPYDPPRSGDKKSVRVKMLAAILRFADELADDYTRTSRFVMGNMKEVHPGSEIFHKYADRLRDVRIDAAERSISLRFELNYDVVSKKYQKHEDSRYLIEEIMDRTLKMHREHMYCTRFMLPDVLIERINVRIDVCSDKYSQVLGRIQYVMAQQGYPETPKGLSEICPKLDGLTGDILEGRVQKLLQQTNSASPYDEPPDLLNES